MKPPVSPYFTPVALTGAYTTDHQTLTDGLRAPRDLGPLTGHQNFCGIPFDLGQPGEKNVILLDQQEAVIDLDPALTSIGGSTYVIFLHAVEDRVTNYWPGLADFSVDGNELGDLVADYTLEYADGTVETTAILRRFAIQQSRIAWGASAFAAIPALKPGVFATLTEEKIAGYPPSNDYGRGETRHVAGRERSADRLWLYALPNPHPDKPLRRIICTPQKERAVLYGITLTTVTEHPLRAGVRRKARLTLPAGVKLNKLGEAEGLQIDLGVVISARAALDYDHDRWLGAEPVVQPVKAEQAVIVEYSAHPQAKLYVPTGTDTHHVYDLATSTSSAVTSTGSVTAELVEVASAHRPVTIRVVEGASGQPVPVRIHFHGTHGEYLPPRGNHRKVNPFWFEDNYGEFVNQHNQYAYILGECIVDLPLGDVYVEITKGYECKPVRTRFTVTPETETMTFPLEKVLHWRERGWVTADTHVHFLSPSTALLEGQAEGVHVVNLLASQWGEMFSNVTDFDGRTTLGAKDFGGDGEFLVRVGTENRMQTLGHISLLGYSGRMIHPLCTGGPSESAIGDPQEVTMAEWAQRCIDQGGLVVMPHAPNPQLERAADIVLELVHAIELMTFNPLSTNNIQVNPYGLADWYRYLNLGYQVPLSGGSDKMSASSLLGGIRTYTQLGNLDFTYENWMTATKRGNTFVTVGPLVELQVEGVAPGGKLHVPATGGTVNVTWKVESVSLPIDAVEVVVGGFALEQTTVNKALRASGSVSVPVNSSTWIAIRVRGSYKGQVGDIAAHTSAVQVLVEGKPLFSPKDAVAVLEQIEGAIAYVDTIAPRPAAQRFKQMRTTLEAAYNRLHQRMHANGHFHRHTPLHDHEQAREH
ncbi:MAG: CehA/McbA family metallohydrolase [Caldilineaceae bacterium]